MRIIDKKSIDIFISLKIAHKNCSKKYCPYSNVFGVFMHEIMIYLTNYIIIKESRESYNQDINFPFLNDKYVNFPFKIKHNKNNSFKSKKNIKNFIRIFSFFIKLFHPNRLQIYLNKESSLPFSFNKFFFHISKNIFPVYFINESKLFLLNRSEQINELKIFLTFFCKKEKVRNPDIFTDNFIDYVTQFLDDNKRYPATCIYITGTNAKLSNRIDSANFLHFGSKVVEFAHGEQAALTLNDPVIGYTEMSYSSYNITYGTDCLSLSEYNKPLYGHSPQLIFRNSDFIKSYYNANNIIYSKLSSDTKILYIPTLLSGNVRYGPFRDIDDSEYIEWQNTVMNLNFDITYKAHPKNKQKHEFKYNKIERRNLKDVFQSYDLYILDYMSTAFSIVCATQKPILYYSLGLMNMHKQALDDVKKRVFWTNIDKNLDFSKQLHLSIANYNNNKHTFHNNYTCRYSLTGDNTSEIYPLLKILDSEKI